ncbi:hypothetical protein QWM81_24675 [Streptomyces ficellus]|uniref:Uncharacterized protein n=1 Tax=Streptomyces ficellus TaxID=1977088 RepID=A0ABT7ZCN7_9ACTN|nr:hypothetical protein [Streptomyces ficellus]MDN3297181.1 hypothetical protein [Streptomyces ficellus]
MTYKVGDYVVHEGRTGLITMDLGPGLYRIRFHHGPARHDGSVREATLREHRLTPASAEQQAAAIEAGVTLDNERSYLPGKPRTRTFQRVR